MPNKNNQPFKEDLTDQKFGKITIIGFSHTNKYRTAVWFAKCDCGSEFLIRTSDFLHINRRKDCGCGKRKDYTGLRSGTLEAIKFSHRDKDRGDTMWEIRCDCGIVKLMNVANFLRAKHCGAIQHRKTVTYDYTHPLYHIWVSMRARCRNPKDKAYINYGGRGVRVCEEWDNDYQSFYDWAMANGWEKDNEDIAEHENVIEIDGKRHIEFDGRQDAFDNFPELDT